MSVFTEIMMRTPLANGEALAEFILKNMATIVLVVFTLVLWCFLDNFVKRVLRHLFRLAEERAKQSMRGKDETRRDMVIYRMATLRQLTTQLARAALGLAMCFALLASVGINIRPVLAGIGIAGLGISLAAQSLIKDVINGVLIVVEDQYNVNDWVRIGSYEGTVELFTLRLTRLRSLEGNLIMIPNSTIQEVINYTKDWSYAAIYVTIPYEADYPKAKEIMLALADETVAGGDPQIYGPYSFSGITDYVSDGVKFRCLIKTAPGYQWKVGYKFREELRARYNAAGIRFAYPAVSNYIGASVRQAARQPQSDGTEKREQPSSNEIKK